MSTLEYDIEAVLEAVFPGASAEQVADARSSLFEMLTVRLSERSSQGGRTLAAKSTPEQRQDRARKASQARWTKYKESKNAV